MASTILFRGGGDLASGTALRLHRSGIQVVITELAQPLVVRRLVSYAQAVFGGKCTVEETTGVLVDNMTQINTVHAENQIPILVDPDAKIVDELHPEIIVDARMTKSEQNYDLTDSGMIIGLGPGFIARKNCHAAVETQRGRNLGRVIWEGPTAKNTGIPSQVSSYGEERVLRAPRDGKMISHASICDSVLKGDLIAKISGESIIAPFDGVVRGLLHEGVSVQEGTKIGDIDPRPDVDCTLVSDKALAVGGGVLEAILSNSEVRKLLWSKDEPG